MSTKSRTYSLLFVGATLESHKNFAKRFYDENKLGPGILIGGIIALLAVSLVFFVGLPALIRVIIEGQLQLRDGTDIMKHWTDIPVPILWKIRFFNITNPDAIEKGERFNVVEVGPYVIEEKRTKKFIETNVEEDTLTYDETMHYFLRPDLSNGTFDDLINIPNIPYISAATISQKYLFDVSLLTSHLLDDATKEGFVSQQVKIRELLFDGVEVNSIYSWLANFAPREYPQELVDDKFAILMGKNGSVSGRWKVKRGIKEPRNIGQIITWNGQKEVNYWNDPTTSADEQHYCNQINGSDGSLYPASPKKEDPVYLFHPLVCRSFHLKFTQESNSFGIPTYQYRLTDDVLASPEKNPNNQCFCHQEEGDVNGKCFRGGYRLSPCHSEAPVAITKPHFLDGEQHFIDAVEGMNPNREKHDAVLEIEPTTGIFVRASFRLQVNIELHKLKAITHFENVPSTMMPFLWIELEAGLTDDLQHLVRGKLLLPIKLMEVLKWIVVGATLIFILMGLCLTGSRALKNRRRRREINSNRADIENLNQGYI